MNGPWPGIAIEIGFALLGALVVPWAVMRMLVPTLEASGVGVANYRGRRVALGLGVVWLVWGVGVLAAGALLDALSLTLWSDWQFPPSASAFSEFAPLVLVLGAMAAGMADDVFGSHAEKGFRGHLWALTSGRLSTGALKLLAIGALAAAGTLPRALASGRGLVGALTVWVLDVLAIGLTANLVNLFDLRPGRALKVYSALTVLGVFAIAAYGLRADALLAAVLLLGPVASVWRFDLGERAMLGDAGANAAGALAGWLAVVTLPAWALAAYVAVVLVLNLVSEKFSFSAVIERNPLLSWLDGLGRLPAKQPEADDAEKSSREVVTREK